MPLVRLTDLPRGTWASLRLLDVDPNLKRRLEALGFESGAQLRVLRAAPFGGPLQVELDSGASAAVDARVAQALEVEPRTEG